jgi:hypothetical protein
MGYRKVDKVTRAPGATDEVVVTVDFSKRPADAGALVTVFVSQASGALAIGSAVVPADNTSTLNVSARLQQPDLRRFTDEDPLTAVSHVTEIWNSVLLNLRPDAAASRGTPTVWELQW